MEALETRHPQMRALFAMLSAFCTWANQPAVSEALLAMREWALVDDRLQEYRRRWESEGTPISLEEATCALRLLMYDAFNEQVEPIQYLVHGLGETSDEDVIAKYIKRAETTALYWDTLTLHKESLIEGGKEIPPVLLGWPPKCAQRPDGRGRPRRWMFRDKELIPESIQKLEGCGLPVTSRDGPSIVAAVAEVFGLSSRNVRAIWESAPNRSGKRARHTYGNQPCCMCGRNSVPTWRAQRAEFVCTLCVPSGA